MSFSECYSSVVFFFPLNTEQKSVFNIFAFSVALHLTVLPQYILVFVFEKFILVFKKASDVSSHRFLTASFYFTVVT